MVMAKLLCQHNSHLNCKFCFNSMNSGDTSQMNIDTVFESFARTFEESTSFVVSGRIARREVKYRLNAIHNASGIPCMLQIEADANKIEAAQIIRNCLRRFVRNLFLNVTKKKCISFTKMCSVPRSSSDCIDLCLATHVKPSRCTEWNVGLSI